MNQDIEDTNKHNNLTTDNKASRMTAEILAAQGVTDVVVSPGSRNAPLLVAFAREKRMKKWVIVDERSAAFTALGIAQQSGRPVALVCTSGSALLNYAPALAEAYYQHIPLIVISSDRPTEWIDQNDSQTIRQPGALANIVKRTFDIPASCELPLEHWWVNRMINEAIAIAKRTPARPVHINVQLREPLCGETHRNTTTERVIADASIERRVSTDDMLHFANTVISGKKVMVVVGMIESDNELSSALSTLAKLPNVIVLTETIANLRNPLFIPTIDRTLSAIADSDKNDLAPDILISIGGALITRMLKQYLRDHPAAEQWRVGIDDAVIDTMQHLTNTIDIDPASFFNQLNEATRHCDIPTSDYAASWKAAEHKGALRHAEYINSIEWCDLKAFARVLPSIPENYNLQLSNGTTIRYAQLFDCKNIAHSNCNRGVAGIDGSTSTALGASLANGGSPTLFITGDMSLSYDINGLASQYNSPNFKIIVICNGGGGIFRFIKGPSDLPELEQYFEVNRDLPIDKYAAAFGFDYFSASSDDELTTALSSFMECNSPAILAIHTPNTVNAEVLKSYFTAIHS